MGHHNRQFDFKEHRMYFDISKKLFTSHSILINEVSVRQKKNQQGGQTLPGYEASKLCC